MVIWNNSTRVVSIVFSMLLLYSIKPEMFIYSLQGTLTVVKNCSALWSDSWNNAWLRCSNQLNSYPAISYLYYYLDPLLKINTYNSSNPSEIYFCKNGHIKLKSQFRGYDVDWVNRFITLNFMALFISQS